MASKEQQEGGASVLDAQTSLSNVPSDAALGGATSSAAAAAATTPPPPPALEDVPLVNKAAAPLFEPFKLGRFQLSHRLVYPPLTRMRCTEDYVPVPVMAEYYAQRTTKGGLIISEGVYPSDRTLAYPRAPGLFNDAQVEAWKPVTKPVRDKGGIFFAQLWHCGRVTHPAFIGGRLPIAPSPIPPSGAARKNPLRPDLPELPVPEALTLEGIAEVVEQYRSAARRAIEAGFDGVELHGANGYLLAQFTNSGTNQRTDEYGGSIENRARFPLEVVKAVADEIGADRVGYRVSPFNAVNDADDDHPYATYIYLTEALNKLGLAYLHVVEPRVKGTVEVDNKQDSVVPFRKVWRGAFISAGGYNAENSAPAVASGHTDLVAIGRHWIANPDLPTRLKLGAPLEKYNRATFYTAGVEGLVDYPFLHPSQIPKL